MSGEAAAFTAWPDLAARALGAAVVWANDEFFAAKENLIKAAPPVFAPATFTHRGQEYDGWETRRRRAPRSGAGSVADPGFDSAVVRLASPGVVHGVVVDTAFFLGNFPPRCSVDGTWCDGYPGPDELAAARWTEIVPPYRLSGGAEHHIPVDAGGRRFSHIRLNMLPDGGIARFRVHGEPLPDPALLDGLTVNLAARRDGARSVGCSDRFYGDPDRMLMPGLAANMGDGWENARRRDGRLRLGRAAPGRRGRRRGAGHRHVALPGERPRPGPGVGRPRAARNGPGSTGLVRDPADDRASAGHAAPVPDPRRPARHPSAARRVSGRRSGPVPGLGLGDAGGAVRAEGPPSAGRRRMNE